MCRRTIFDCKQVDFASISTRAGALRAIETGIDLDATNDEGYAPLHLARNEEVARALVEADADVDVRTHGCAGEDGDDGFSTPLHLARDAGVVDVLVGAGADVEAINGSEETPLHRARNAGVVDALIEAEADIEAEVAGGMETPLERAKNVEVARALLEGGADVDHWRVDYGGFVYGTPLLNSTSNEDISLLLIEHGANVNASYDHERGGEVSAVYKHVKANNFRVVREMLHKKAMVDSGDLVAATEKSRDEMLRLLIESVGVSVTNGHGHTVLHSAKDHLELLLSSSGANIHARDKAGNTPLHTNCSDKAASLFIEKGANIEAVNHEGETPLHWLCESVSGRFPFGRVDKVDKLRVLVRAGASTRAKRADGKTPLDLLKIDDLLLRLFCRE